MDRLRARYAMPIESEADLAGIAIEDFSNDREEVLHAVGCGQVLLPLLQRDVLTLLYLNDLSLIEYAGGPRRIRCGR